MSAHEKTNELFLAIGRNNIELTNNLMSTYGSSLLNSQDIFGTTALHLALKYGHESLIECLLKQPEIDINLQAYQQIKAERSYSPLDFAFKYDNSIKTIELLLDAGATTQHPELLLDLFLEGNEDQIEDSCNEEGEPYTQQELAEFTHLFEKLLIKIPEVGFKEGWPLSLYYIESYNQATDESSKMLLKILINLITPLPTDKYTHSFLIAKDLTHAFPSSQEYETNNEFNKELFKAEGFTSYQSLKTFHSSFIDYLDLANYSNVEQHTFSEVNTTYHIAMNYANNYGMHETSIELFNLYEAGQTILLRSGWEEHAVDVILDKSLNLYIVANAGDRYLELPPGVKAYNPQKPITADNIYKILNNSQQQFLEYDQYYDLQLNENSEFSEYFPDQIYGNCSLNSLLLANWSLIHLTLHKTQMPNDLAKTTAHAWHDDIVEHHKTQVLKNYLSDPYLKGDKVLYDTLINYESTLNHPEKETQAKLILNYLTSESHVEPFANYYQEHQTDFSPELTLFMQHNGYKEKVIQASDVLNLEETKENLFAEFENSTKVALETQIDMPPNLSLHANLDKFLPLEEHLVVL